MTTSAWIADRLNRWAHAGHALRQDYAAVQDAAAVESMRRIQRTFWVFGPIELVLAVWYLVYPVPADRPDLQLWAQSLLTLHVFTALVTGVLLLVVGRSLRGASSASAVKLQMAMCFTYLMYGVAVSYLDIHVGGVQAFILICCGVAGLSLMRPFISITIYGVTLVVMVGALQLGVEPGAPRAIMVMNSVIAAVLSVVLSAIIFHQYARGLLLQRELALLASQDPLTLLPNRREVLLRINQAVAMRKRSAQSGALLFIDLDHFKVINDTRGHQVGDMLLKEVAQRLSGCVRITDTVARLGGDEFLVLLDNLASDLGAASREAETVARKFIDALNRPCYIEGADVQSSPSIGIAMVHDGTSDANELMRQADLAMYQAKDAGRNTVRFYDHDIQQRLMEKAALEADLRKALERNELQLYYQPQVTADGQIVGAEALLRWKHPHKGFIPPGQFIPIAESSALIEQIGSWVVHTACETLERWARHSTLQHLSLAVNVSARQFAQASFVPAVLAELAPAQFDIRRLKLELTESMLVTDMDDVVAKMEALSQHGVRFSLDDFGTGYSSLAYIKRLPLDQLKIDQSFVRDLHEDANDAAIIRVIVGLAQTLDLEVIAEGVETAAQRDYLLRAGCHNFQGYFFGRPMPADALEALVCAAPEAVPQNGTPSSVPILPA
ncbi:MAG: EAL domain-containing protein [Rhodoferax sp.]|nr:MAG: EAL domain-containing protein [Rhodoferax sp.]